MFKEFNRQQDYLLPPSLRELIPEGDLVYFVAEVVDQIDLQPLYSKYDPLGQNAYHPGMMLGLLFYAYAQGIFSSRKIAEHLKYDVRYMYLSGTQHPDFRTIADFRKDNLSLLQKYFVDLVRLCMELGMVSLQSLALDGTKVKASASKKRMKGREAIAQQLAEVESEIARLLEHAQSVDRAEEASTPIPFIPGDMQLKDLQELREKLREAKAKLDSDPQQQQVSLTDPDCRMQDRQGPGYNCQIVVDSAQGVIVSAEVVSDPNDSAQLLPMLELAETNTASQGQPKKLDADSGYANGANYMALKELPHIDAYVPPQDQHLQMGMPQPPYDKYHFHFHPETRKCLCPLGYPMKLRGRRIVRSVQHYNFQGTECPDCPARKECTKSKYRRITLTEADPLVKAMREKMKSPPGRESVRTRMTTVEPAFGQIKEHIGFRRFRLRRLKKVKGEFALLCTAYNLLKMHKFLGRLDLIGAADAARCATAGFLSFAVNFLRAIAKSLDIARRFRWLFPKSAPIFMLNN